MLPKITFLRCADIGKASSAVAYFLAHNGHDGRSCVGVRDSMWVSAGDWMHAVYWTSEAKKSVTCIMSNCPSAGPVF